MDDNNLKELATRLRVLRAERNMTQEELAEKSKVSNCSVYFIENCKKRPRMATLIKIAKALSVEPEELLKYVC